MAEISLRTEHAESHPEDSVTLREAVGHYHYDEIMSIDPIEIPDDEFVE